MKVLIVVTHLLGTGHLRRAMTLARAFAETGHEVRVASGGTPVAGVSAKDVMLVQLPPVKSDGTKFNVPLTEDDTLVTSDYLAHRLRVLLELLIDPPDILITELFPFGRRVLSEEFTALLDAARALPAPPLILSSIRDILAPPSRPAKADRTAELVETYYDGVLVHSDPSTTPLEVSWPISETLGAKLRYTGYVALPAPSPHPDAAGAEEILVSAGGGAVGRPIFQAAVQAAGKISDRTWRILVGGTQPKSVIDALRSSAPGNVIIEPVRPDFRQMLGQAGCSVSMAGYNTAMDLLQTGIPALLIPFDEGSEVEQGLRAQSLSGLDGIEVLPSANLTADRVAQAVERLLKSLPRDASQIRLDGALETVRIACTMREATE